MEIIKHLKFNHILITDARIFFKKGQDNPGGVMTRLTYLLIYSMVKNPS